MNFRSISDKVGEAVDLAEGAADAVAKIFKSSVPEPREARTCTCRVDDKLRVLSTKDPKYFMGLKKPDAKFDSTNEHYGWRLGEAKKAGFEERTDVAPTEVEICVSREGDKDHFNTIASHPWELVKLDCGYWGSYFRDRTPEKLNLSREFGMIMGHEVWLCRFHTEAGGDHLKQLHEQIDKLPPGFAGQRTLARKFLELCKAHGCAVQLISHAAVRSGPLSQGLDDNRLVILLPDLHLPERWAAEPAIEDAEKGIPGRHADKDARDELQWRLIAMQHKPGRLWGNPLGTEDQNDLQRHIQSLLADSSDAEFTVKSFGLNRNLENVYAYSPSQFLAELAYVERRIRAGSTWFYAPASGYKAMVSAGRYVRETVAKAAAGAALAAGATALGVPAPVAGVLAGSVVDSVASALKGESAKDVAKAFGSATAEGAAQAGVEAAAGKVNETLGSAVGTGLTFAVPAAKYATGDHYKSLVSDAPSTPEPAPAIDLCLFLEILNELREGLPPHESIELFQLGDLFELWMGREFLYFDFPHFKEHGLTANKDLKKAWFVLKATQYYVLDTFQKRSDAGWDRKDEPTADGVRKFIFDPIDSSLLERLFVTGASAEWNALKPASGAARKAHMKRAEFLREIGKTWLENRRLSATGFSPAKLEAFGESVTKRASSLLDQRISNIENFYGPLTPRAKASNAWAQLSKLTGWDGGLHDYRAPVGDGKRREGEWAWSEKYSRPTDPAGEYFWNRPILDLLKKLGCTWIHGNHDGYRSDPAIKGRYDTEEFISQHSLWLEHVHRFDPFNRDGRSCGAGVTNLVYYFMDELLFLDKVKDFMLVQLLADSSERAENIPGAAQWFLISGVVDRDATRRLPERGWTQVKPFAVFACGHTHAPDLVRIQFEFKKS